MRRALQVAAVSALLFSVSGELRAQGLDSLTLPMERTPAGWLITVHVCIPESPDQPNGLCYPHRLLLDTGATESALDAAYLALPRGKEKRTVHLGAGSEERAVLPPLYLLLRRPALGFGARVAPVDVDLSRIREACQCKVAGLVGVNFLEQFAAVTLDFEKKELRLTADQRR